MANVINIGEHRITRANSKYRVIFGDKSTDSCAHTHIKMDDNGEIVTCDDCGKQVSPYWFVRDFFERYDKYRTRLEARWAEVAEAEKRTLRLRAAQKVERAWRRRKRMPACPHCHRGISQHDGFGNEMVRRDKQPISIAHVGAAAPGSAS